MAVLEEIARDALDQARKDIARNRRALIVAIGVLALVHLLTIGPYLRTSRDVAIVERDITQSRVVVGQLNAQIDSLRSARTTAEDDLGTILRAATDQMISDFAGLRSAIELGLSDKVGEPGESIGSSSPFQSDEAQIQNLPQADPGPLPMQQTPMNLPQMQEQPIPIDQSPFAQQAQPPDPVQWPAPELIPGQLQPPMSNWALDEELQAILNDMRAGDANAPERLAAYSRARIVDPAYERANSEWTSDIKPRYLRAVAEAKAAIGELAELGA